MLIVFEGIDGCGKETQIDLLKKKMDFTLFKYPTRNFQLLNDHLERKISLDPKSLFLLFLSDIANEQKKVRTAATDKKLVILDRYVFSTIAYEVDGMSYEQGKKIIESVGYAVPDVVLLLDIDGRTSQERKKKQKSLDRYEEDAKYLDKVRANYNRLFEERFLTPNWHKIDASKSIEEVHKDILRYLHL